jgi:hypothetical protein
MGQRYYQRTMYGVMLGDQDDMKAFFAKHGHPVNEDELDEMGNEAYTINMGNKMVALCIDPSGDECAVGIHCKKATDKVVNEFKKYFPNVDAGMINFTEIV